MLCVLRAAAALPGAGSAGRGRPGTGSGVRGREGEQRPAAATAPRPPLCIAAGGGRGCSGDTIGTAAPAAGSREPAVRGQEAAGLRAVRSSRQDSAQLPLPASIMYKYDIDLFFNQLPTATGTRRRIFVHGEDVLSHVFT